MEFNASILLEPNEYVGIFNKRIDVLLEEYKTLRQELMSTQASLNTIFYYGLFTLGAIFALVQGLAGQINSLFKPDVQTLELDTSRFYALTHSLFIILAFVIPAISFIFITKWMSNARSIAVHGAYLTEVESELNRAFARVKTFETLMKQSTNRTSGSKTRESSTTRRLYQTGNLFNDYELNIGWETTLRRTRKSTGQTQLIFGGYHVFVIMGFFGSIGLIGIFSPLFLFGIKLYEPNLLNYLWFISLIISCFITIMVVYQFCDIRKWLLTPYFETNTIEFIRHKPCIEFLKRCIRSEFIRHTIEFIRHKLCIEFLKRCIRSVVRISIALLSTFALFLAAFAVILNLLLPKINSLPEEFSIFSENKMIAAKQEIISSTYSQKIDGIFEKEKGTAPSPQNGTAQSSEYKAFTPNDYQKSLAIEALDKLNQISLKPKTVSEKPRQIIMDFIKYLKARKITDLSGVQLQKADLRGVNLSGFILSGADLTEAKLNNADLSGADLTKVKGVDCKKLNTEKVTLDGKTTLPDEITKGPCPLAKT